MYLTVALVSSRAKKEKTFFCLGRSRDGAVGVSIGYRLEFESR
jgi:hypothetical protein